MALKAAVLGAPAKRLLWAVLVGEVAQAAVLGWCGPLGFSRLGWASGGATCLEFGSTPSDQQPNLELITARGIRLYN